MKRDTVIMAIFVALLCYVAIATQVWALRNPRCNDQQVLVHMLDVLAFRKTEGCQP